ncbi:MAG: hypothetical protein RIE08_01800 [Acidimicrobiales bacterium]
MKSDDQTPSDVDGYTPPEICDVETAEDREFAVVALAPVGS